MNKNTENYFISTEQSDEHHITVPKTMIHIAWSHHYMGKVTFSVAKCHTIMAYDLTNIDKEPIQLPLGSRIFGCRAENNKIKLLVLIETTATAGYYPIDIKLVREGVPFDTEFMWNYIGAVQIDGNWIHVMYR